MSPSMTCRVQSFGGLWRSTLTISVENQTQLTSDIDFYGLLDATCSIILSGSSSQRSTYVSTSTPVHVCFGDFYIPEYC